MTKKRLDSTRPRLFTYIVDKNDVVIHVNANWLRFARENDAPHLTRRTVLGRSLWDFIGGLETRHIYRLLMDHVRQKQRRVVFTYRCDSPTLRRYMYMEIVPAPDLALEFRSYLLRQESREHIRLLDPAIPRNHELVRMCSWCHRVLCEENWLPVEDGIQCLGLFGTSDLPRITHGICFNCMALFKDLP